MNTVKWLNNILMIPLSYRITRKIANIAIHQDVHKLDNKKCGPRMHDAGSSPSLLNSTIPAPYIFLHH